MTKKSILKGGENKMALRSLLDKSLVAQRYGKSEGTIDQWISKKKIPYKKIGSSVFFDANALEQWEKGHEVSPVAIKSNQRKQTPDTL